MKCCNGTTNKRVNDSKTVTDGSEYLPLPSIYIQDYIVTHFMTKLNVLNGTNVWV